MHDLRSFLQHLSRHRQLLEIDAPVDPVLASTTLSLRARAWDDAGQSGLSGWSGISVY